MVQQFSLYELLSFVLPGVLIVAVAEWIGVNLWEVVLISFHSEVVVGTLYLLFALVCGGLLHSFTFWLVTSCKWAKKWLYPTVQEMKYDERMRLKIIPYLNKEYQKTIDKSLPLKDSSIPAKDLFDYAYNRLEIAGVLTQVKNFQSLYFLYRNLAVLAVLVALCLGGVLILYSKFLLALGWIVVGFVFCVVCTCGARWFRKKMIMRLFSIYYVYLLSQQSTQPTL